MEVIVAKRCTRCAKCKPIGDFRIDLTTKDGRKHACTDCLRVADKAQYKARRERGVQRTRARAKPEPLWPVPTHTFAEGLDCVRLGKWRGPVSHEPMVARL